MTERETKVLTGMLDMIFASKGSEEDQPKTLLESMTSPSEGGVGPIHVDDLFGRLRRFAARPTQKARSRAAEMLDKKKEQMSYCTDDQQLLQWASREVFDESVRYEEAAKRAIAEASNSGSTTTQAPPLQSPIYPQMIAHLMQTFRVQYHDPNLALFIFNHAQNSPSYAYNELIETRWTAFKDLKGVLAAVNEMEDSQTGGRHSAELGRELHLGNNEDTKTLASIEETLSRMARHSKRSAKTGWDTWKKEVLDDGDDDGFDDWASVDLTKFGEPEPQAQDRFRRPGKGGQVGNKNFRNRSSHKSQESYL
ncbi:hypothetical protein BDZ97DRAFT_1990235 [Flammula alnicola]|nr:hypothetical protein BDZ97DRAFT_1990235 [Flammula alnicola]